MLAFWPDVVRPILEALEPTSIVEIGSEEGRTTRKLLELARDLDAHVYSIDPAPVFDAEALSREFDRRLSLIQLPSLVGLPSIEQFDVVLIDGDHNWFTVFNELQLIDRRSSEIGQPMPLVFLHDVSWPYGRRDMYYSPSNIPEEHRRPYARRGISPASSRLVAEGGFNAKLFNALEEGGPRNGVLTAVEDYVASTSRSIETVIIPAVFGLAMLLPAALAESKPGVAAKVRAWAVPEVERFISRMEMARIAMLTGVAG